MGNPTHTRQPGFTVIDASITIVTCLVVVFLGLTIEHKLHHTDASTQPPGGSPTTATSPSTASAYTILFPATVPSKIPECSHTLTFSSNGDSGPVTCANGDLNATEWNSLATLEPKVLTLGYSATTVQVQAALCADVNANVSNPIEETAYQIASLYYGWHFTANPSSVIENGTCVNVDD